MCDPPCCNESQIWRSSMKKKLVMIGRGGAAETLADSLIASGEWDLAAFAVERRYLLESLLDRPVVAFETLPDKFSPSEFHFLPALAKMISTISAAVFTSGCLRLGSGAPLSSPLWRWCQSARKWGRIASLGRTSSCRLPRVLAMTLSCCPTASSPTTSGLAFTCSARPG